MFPTPPARPTLVSTALVCAGLLTAAQAQADERWLAYELTDASGQTVAQLEFGTPESDVLVFAASCPGATTSDVDVSLYVATGQIAAGDPANLTFTTPGHSETRPGAIVDDVFGAHAVAHLPPDDAVWKILADGLTGTVGVEGQAATPVHLRGSRVAIAQFLASCATLTAASQAAAEAIQPTTSGQDDTGATNDADSTAAAAEPDAETDDASASDDAPAADAVAATTSAPAPPAPPAVPYPLYVTGEDPVPAFSSVRFGIVLDPIPPGTIVRRTGNTGTRDGDEWVEVTTVDARARTVWVLLAAVEPDTAGSSEYQNPSDGANLLIRAEPSPTAPVVGTIPPLAIGIMDLGQPHQGDWVQVRFGPTSGWVSYLHVRPIGADLRSLQSADASSASLGTPSDTTPPPTPEPYSATHGAWSVDCDPCRDPTAGPTCRIDTASIATARRRATLTLSPAPEAEPAAGESDPPVSNTDPALTLRYAAGTQLPGPADAALTLTIDAAPPVAIAAADWQIDAATGDALIAGSALTPYLPALGVGQTLTLTTGDPARNWVDQFALNGFGMALSDMTGRLPMPSQFGDAEACPVDEPEVDGNAPTD